MTGFPETRRAWRRLKRAWADYWAAHAGCHLVPASMPFIMNGHVLFSVRDKISRAIADPGLYFERLRSDDGMLETLDHWQARAAIEAMMRCVASSPSFALAMEARRAEAGNTDSVHDSAGPKDNAHD